MSTLIAGRLLGKIRFASVDRRIFGIFHPHAKGQHDGIVHKFKQGLAYKEPKPGSIEFARVGVSAEKSVHASRKVWTLSR